MQHDRKQVAVWDVFVRLFHWCLVVAVAVSFYTTKTDGIPFLFPIEVHAQAGYLIISLLIFRIIWGVLGTTYARFSTFVYGPRDTAVYTKALFKRRAPRYASHNPLGGWMVVLLLLSLSFQAVSGLFLSDDIFFQGPLYGLLGRDISGELASLHALNSDVLLILIGLHLVGVVVHALQGENLVAAMVTGIKRFTSEPVDIKQTHRTKHHLFALGAFLVAAGICGWLWFYPY
ncbi:cytochrome b/b6 domain-containing protein [Halomonas alkaliantarctica]|uniref:cytochrome b/b6 domain-containing protein n=1 Tax=Halomonas alkaliantarctica TaxID=232346 RepID=UPI00265978E7|nr:cytochrome b/b6 domain-containing protein [Halomonas alkaliantarctica]